MGPISQNCRIEKFKRLPDIGNFSITISYYDRLPLWLSWQRIRLHCGNLGSIHGLGRSPGEGEGYPLQDSGLENFIDSIVHVVAKSRIQLSHFHFLFFQGLRVLFFFSSLEIRTGRAGAEKVKVLL